MTTQNPEHLSLGIIGPGRQSINWARLLDHLGAEVWYYSPEGDERAEVSAKFDNVTVYPERPFYHDGYTDLIIFAGTQDEDRDQYIEEALLDNISVICEPPLAITKEDAEDLYKAAREGNALLVTAFRGLYTNAFQMLKHWASEISPVTYLRFNWYETEWNLDPIWDILPEPLAMMQSLVKNSIPSEFNAYSGEGWLDINFVNPEKFQALFTACSGLAVPEYKIILAGEEGSIECSPFQEEVILKNRNGEVSKDHTYSIGPNRNILMYAIKNIKAFRNGEKKVIPYGELGVNVTNILSQVDITLYGEKEENIEN